VQILHRDITISRPQNRHLVTDSTKRLHQEKSTYNYGDFMLIFIGSGGHTTEIISLLRLFEPFDHSIFRRYIVTTGDSRSQKIIDDFEAERSERRRHLSHPPGLYEIVWVARARYVGQSWLTTPFTALESVFDCYKILTMRRPLSDPIGPIEFPQTIICNGPGSSAVFVLVSHLMRMYGLIPANRCVTLFVESIARVRSLSLTGKIFYYLDIADAFVVQHKGVKEVYPDVICEEMLVKRVYTSPGVNK
jgi:beta-1,4-N-acetylglucosaminyltransferase